MKILFITGSLNQGGAEYQILELAKLFQEKDNEVEVFAITDYTFYKYFVIDNNIKYNHLSNDQSKIKRTLLTAKKIREYKPDIIVSYLKVPSQLALFAKIISTFKTKLIIGERTSLILPSHDKYYFNLMRLSDAVTVNSISKLKYLKDKFPAISKKSKFFPNIIDIEKYKVSPKTYIEDEIKIGFVGRIAPEKNVSNLVKAIGLIDTNIHLLIYGDARNANYIEEINTFIKQNALAEKISIKGKTDDVVQVYKKIDLLCLISDYEGFSNVLSEGLCMGLPIITSNIDENKYLIEDTVNGFVVDQKSPEDIARGIREYLSLSTDSKKKMAKSNRSKALKMFDKDILYNDYLKLIKSI